MIATQKAVAPLPLARPQPASYEPESFVPCAARIAHGLRDLLARFSLFATVTPVEVAGVDAIAAPHQRIAIDLPELGATSALLLPDAFVIALVERYYGGAGGAIEEARALTIGERRVLDSLARDFLPILGSALAPAAVVAPRLRSEDAPRASRTPLFIQGWSVRADATDALLGLEIPEPLLAAVAPSKPRARSFNGAWATRLTDAVLQTHLPVRTILARPELPLDRLLRLAPGDVIPVCLPALVPVTAAGRLIGHGSVGEANGRTAVKLERFERGFAA